ncbi:MurR/RpiR family transcriptional regulator [Spiroplasma taiwanense]|uniref:Transcriptional regulator n=1 Tax=Spiroplasma taiwanense CT-1 TaxID=1276220 RepID=S5LU86_9MOLU|nr:MurR/RpiR family transcriptional regulator [Spiroplasma taiwanense]AGR41319.1 transcriptional regulator [Spiroplasma taiwanense CT-1]
MELTSTEKLILLKIKNDIEVFTTKSISELSKLYYASDASILRLVKKLGYKTLKEMQIEFGSKLKIDNMLDDFKEDFLFDENANISETISSITALSLYSIFKTEENLNKDSIEEFVNIISDSGELSIFGIGNSKNSVEFLNNQLKRIGVISTIHNSVHGFLIHTNFYKNKNIALIISNSLKTKEVTFILNYLIENKIPYLIISSIDSTNNNLFIEKAKSYILYSTNSKEKYSFPMISSFYSQIFIINIIFNRLIQKTNDFKTKIELGNKLTNKWNES